MAPTTTEITLKLLIDTNTKKVVFAEAKKDFVDLLFGLLQVPLGSIMKNLLKNEMDGVDSIGKVYRSVIDLESSYLLPTVSKDILLSPEMSSSSSSVSIPPLLQSFASSNRKIETNETNFTSQQPFSSHIFSMPSAPSSGFGSSSFSCGMTSASSSSFGSSMVTSSISSKPEGFVRGMTPYMVMDDLMVKPMSPISTITLLNTIGIKDLSSLVEKNVTINFKKGLELVKASFLSDTVLSDVFLSKQAPGEDTNFERQTHRK